MRCVLLLFLTSAVVSLSIKAKPIWSDFSVSYLNGHNYQVGDNQREVLTFEYTSAHNWGGQFLFIDKLKSKNNDSEIYGEWSPKLKLSNLDTKIINNVYLATTLEMGNFVGHSGYSNSFTNYLIGVGTDLKLPSFKYASLSLYHRNNEQSDNGYQVTFVWGVPIGPLFYDGFLDITSTTDDKQASANFTSQLKYNIGEDLGLKSKLYLGVEYAFWQNKFGINNVDEKNLNLLVKYHF